jgi:hypothetical protein
LREDKPAAEVRREVPHPKPDSRKPAARGTVGELIFSLYRQLDVPLYPPAAGVFDSGAFHWHQLTAMTENTPSGRPVTAEDVVRRIAAEWACQHRVATGRLGVDRGRL